MSTIAGEETERGELKRLILDGGWSGDDRVKVATTVMGYESEFSLSWWQQWYIRNPKPLLILNKSRRIGWSFVSGLSGLLFALDPKISRYTKQFISYSLDDAKEKIATARQFYYSIPEVLRPKKIVTDSKTALEFQDINGISVSRLQSWPCKDPRGKGGDLSYDEFAFFGKNDARIYTAGMGVIAREADFGFMQRSGYMEIGSTPLGKKGRFYEILTDTTMYKKYLRREIPWYLSEALCRDVPAVAAMVKEGSLPTIRDLVRDFGTDAIQMISESMPWEDFMQEFNCDFQDDRTTFFPLELIYANMPEANEEIIPFRGNEGVFYDAEGSVINTAGRMYATNKDGEFSYETAFHELESFYDPELHGVLYAGYDVGRKKDMSELYIWGKKGDRRQTMAVITLKKVPFDDQESFLKMVMNDLPIHRLCIDATGMGMHLSENLHKKYPSRVEGVEFTNENKESMALDVRYCMERGNYALPRDRKLQKNLQAIQKTITASGNVRFDADRTDAIGHADLFWALALAEYAVSKGEKKKSGFYSKIREKGGGKPRSQLDVLKDLRKGRG